MLDWTTATLRWGEENSIASIFINDAAAGFVEDFDLDAAKGRRSARVAEQAFGPFDDGDAIGPQIFLKAGGDDLFARFEAIEIKMEQRQSSTGIDVHEREGWRMDASSDAKAAREAFDQLRFSGAEIAAQAEDQATRGGAAPLFAERGGFLGAMRNERSHEPSVGVRPFCHAA